MIHGRILVAALAVLASPPVALADEGGISFWLPGQYGSFAATPAQPGWTWTSVYYHTSVDAGAGQQFPRGGMLVRNSTAPLAESISAPCRPSGDAPAG